VGDKKSDVFARDADLMVLKTLETMGPMPATDCTPDPNR